MKQRKHRRKREKQQREEEIIGVISYSAIESEMAWRRHHRKRISIKESGENNQNEMKKYQQEKSAKKNENQIRRK